MIVNEDNALARLLSPDNLVNKLELRKLHSNRNGRKEIPPMVQTLMVDLHENENQKQAEVAKQFGVTQAEVSYLHREGKHVNREIVDRNTNKVHDKALESMISCIDTLAPLIPNMKKATDLSKVAADMARVVEKTAPKNEVTSNVKVVIYAPNNHGEDKYEEIVVNS